MVTSIRYYKKKTVGHAVVYVSRTYYAGEIKIAGCSRKVAVATDAAGLVLVITFVLGGIIPILEFRV